MDLRALRTIHTYVSCAFAPLLIFFVITGTGQVLGLHEPKKSGYQPSRLVMDLSAIHTKGTSTARKGSGPFRILVLAMALGFLCTTILGVIMALKAAKHPWVVWLCLILGAAIPWSVILYGRAVWIHSVR